MGLRSFARVLLVGAVAALAAVRLVLAAAVVAVGLPASAADPPKTVELKFDKAEAEFLLTLTQEKQFAAWAKDLLKSKEGLDLLADPPTTKPELVALLTAKAVNAVVDPPTLEGVLAKRLDLLADQLTHNRIVDFINLHHAKDSKGTAASRKWFQALADSYKKVQPEKK